MQGVGEVSFHMCLVTSACKQGELLTCCLEHDENVIFFRKFSYVNLLLIVFLIFFRCYALKTQHKFIIEMLYL